MEILNSINSPYDIRKLNDDELKNLSNETREFIIQKVSKTGGHLASNLGVVELTLALHYVFNTPYDKIVWDVGHQTYTHKIITGRKDDFDNLRQYEGLSGFPKRYESEYDIFETGHSSTSISAALGICRARDIKKENYNVIAIIGDGALTGGMAFEALNDVGISNTNITVILNDNQMSISKNVGSMAAYLSRLRTDPTYFKFKSDMENLLKKIPGIGKNMAETAEKIKDSLKYFFVPGILFEELGFTYLGPIDGHDIIKLKQVFERSKKIKGPVFIHVITKKGKGYEMAEKKPDKYHGVDVFDVDTGEFLCKSKKTYSNVFEDEIVEIAKKDKSIVAITAAMREGTGLKKFSKEFPDRFFDVGIAEQHASTFAAGLSINGMKPIFVVYSTFLQRAYDQILHDVCMQNLPVVFSIDRAGLVGEDGETHQGVFDISFLRHIPNLTVMTPKSTNELKAMLNYAFTIKSPVAIRYPRGSDIYEEIFNEQCEITSIKSEILIEGKDLLVIAIGKMVSYSYKAILDLNEQGMSIGLINARFIKPLDTQTLKNQILKYNKIITIEDNVIMGGFGSGILEFLSKEDITGKSIKTLGFPDKYIEHGNINILFEKYKLDKEGIKETILSMLK